MEAKSFGSMSMHLDEDARIDCCTYPDCAPILTIDGIRFGFTITAAHRRLCGPVDVANARALAEAVAVYLAEVERLANPENSAADTSGRDCSKGAA